MAQVEVYYVEDDTDIGEGVKTYLEQRDFRVTVLNSISHAKQALLRKTPGVILIDINLPDGRGDELCRWMRRRFGKEILILFLTVKGETPDIVRGFMDGGDDYVVKPFDLEVLYMRICALQRRKVDEKEVTLRCDDISLDKEKLAVFQAGEEIIVSQSEYQLLLLLMENKGKTITRTQLLKSIWDNNGSFVNDNTLTVTMKRLREKLRQPSCIKTIRSFGYRMEDTL